MCAATRSAASDRNDGSLRLDHGSPAPPVQADTVFLATGKHDLRGAARPARGTGLVGLKMYYALDPSPAACTAEQRRTDLVRRWICRPAACGIRTRQSCACWCRARDCARRMDEWDRTARLADAGVSASRRSVGRRATATRSAARDRRPALWLYATLRTRQDSPGLFRLGDQATVIASLTGDGVALALASAALASHIWLTRGNAAGAYHSAWARRLAAADAPGIVPPSRLPLAVCAALADAPVPLLAAGHAARRIFYPVVR